MIVLLWIALLVVPVLVGMGIMSVMYGKNHEFVIGFADSYLIGLISCIGMAFVAHIIGMTGKLSLEKTGLIMTSVSLMTLVFSAVVIFVSVKKWKRRYFSLELDQKIPGWLPVLLLILVLVQMLFVFCMKTIVTPGDITLETVQSFLCHDRIYKVMPLTGRISETGMPIRYKILCLPTLYTLLAKGFDLDPELVVCHIVPVVVLGGTYLAYFRLGESIFGRTDLKNRYWFLVIIGMLFWISEGAVFLDGYAALHAGYLGTSVRNLILVPYTVCAVLEKRYWKAVLCILAEMCIVWTFWGLGVCAAITVAILLLGVLEKKVTLIGNMLKIFSEKEGEA